MTDPQKFLEEYADKPVGKISLEEALKVLRRSGYFEMTKSANPSVGSSGSTN